MKNARIPAMFVLPVFTSVLALSGCGSAEQSGEPAPDAAPATDAAPFFTCGSAALYATIHGQCAAMDAQGEGSCLCASMGWVWDGSTCVELAAGFCGCLGGDCDKLTKTEAECLSAHAACASDKTIACSSPARFAQTHGQCTAMDAQGDGSCFCTSMGWFWDGVTCVELPAGFCDCKGDDCDKLTETQDECLTAHATCGSEKSIACGAEELFAKVHDTCAAMNVEGDGSCFCTSMGWFWDGVTCVELPAGFCDCKGDDCDKLTATQDECLATHTPCL